MGRSRWLDPRWRCAAAALSALAGMACARTDVARIEGCTPLHYAPGTAPVAQRTWVRAASGVAPRGDELIVVQDDAHALAAIRGDEVTPLALVHADGSLVREDPRRTRGDKLDLESIVALDEAGARLVAFGSGSAPMRRVIVTLAAGARTATLHDAGPLFERLAAESGFAGSELNVEGAVAVGGKIRFFQRGNGAARGGTQPVNATAEMDRAALLSWIDRGGEPPRVEDVRTHVLGQVGGVPLGFTDATVHRGTVVFVAVAEDARGVLVDGAVTGVRVGRMAAGGGMESVPVVEVDGRPTTRKVEGITPRRSGDGLHAVVDADDPARPAEICTLVLPAGW